MAEDNYLKFLQRKLFTNKVAEILHNTAARKTHKNAEMLLLIGKLGRFVFFTDDFNPEQLNITQTPKIYIESYTHNLSKVFNN